MRKRQFLGSSLAALAFPAAAWAADDAYPSRPLHFTLLNPPGGASDLMGRIFAVKLGEALGQTVIVENRPGKSVGMMYIKNNPADGYNFVLGGFSPTVVPQYLSKIPYDMQRDFMPVSLIATAPLVIVVNASAPYNDVKGFIEAARARPDNFNYGSGGTGTLAHLLTEEINFSAGLKMQHVPYKGSIQAINDLLAGQIDMVPGDPQVVVPQIHAGKLKAIAVTSIKRFSLLPDTPTFVENGMQEIVALNPYGIYLAKGTPKPVYDKFHDAVNTAMSNPELIARYQDLGVEAQHSTPEALADFVSREGAKYGKIIKEKHIHD